MEGRRCNTSFSEQPQQRSHRPLHMTSTPGKQLDAGEVPDEETYWKMGLMEKRRHCFSSGQWHLRGPSPTQRSWHQHPPTRSREKRGREVVAFQQEGYRRSRREISAGQGSTLSQAEEWYRRRWQSSSAMHNYVEQCKSNLAARSSSPAPQYGALLQQPEEAAVTDKCKVMPGWASQP